MELIGIVLSLIGLLFAFETPRRAFIKLFGFKRPQAISSSSGHTAGSFNSSSHTSHSFNLQLIPENAVEVETLIPDSITRDYDTNALQFHFGRASTRDGQAPKLLLRITDPDSDYRTSWSAFLISPSGTIYRAPVIWPGGGKIYRARFATNEPRTGRWRGFIRRSSGESYKFEKMLHPPDDT